MAGCFLGLEINTLGIKATIIESGYKQAVIKDDCRVLFEELPDLSAPPEHSDPFDAGMDAVAQQLDLQTCSAAIIFVSPLMVCFRNIDLPFASEKKLNRSWTLSLNPCCRLLVNPIFQIFICWILNESQT